MAARTMTLMDDGMRRVLLTLAAVSALSLAGCAKIDTPSTLTSQKITLETENFSQSYKVAQLNSAIYDDMAEHFRRHGDGQAEVIVSYDPYSKKNTAMKATDHLQKITGELKKRHMQDVTGSILAVDYSGDEPEMIVGYSSVTARAPDECSMMTGSDIMHATLDFDYRLGCSVQTMTANQVARPADLAGRSPDSADGDGRRARNVVERYRNVSPAATNRALTTYSTQ